MLDRALDIGSNFCERVVDVAVEAANNAVFSSIDTAERLGLESAAVLQNELVVAADTSCNAAYRGIQMLMEGEQASMNSTSTIDLGAAAAEGPSGTILICASRAACALPFISLMGSHCSLPGELLTISRRLYLSTQGVSRRLLGRESASLSLHHTPKRHLTPSNQVVGGVFLHNRRQRWVVSCAQRLSQKLVQTCRHTGSTGVIERGMRTCVH